MNKKILFVDDEQNVLDGIRRQLRRQYAIDTALGPEEGLVRLKGESPYAVVVSDMRMPGMDGIAFLNRFALAAPNTVRMMLTGNSDQQTAIDAVNKGNIFRFLNKPCSTETMVANLEAGIRQHELVNAEQQLLEQTLKGSIEVLVGIMALGNPSAFSRAERIKFYIAHMARNLNLPDSWKFEVAAMLSQIGYVTIPPETMEKFLAGETLDADEEKMIANHHSEACQMLGKIPRLEEISQMIALQNGTGIPDQENNPVHVGAQLLRAATDFEKLLSRGARPYQAIHEMRHNSPPYSAESLNALQDIHPPAIERTACMVPISELRIGMVLAEDIRSSNNNAMIVGKGQIVNGLMQRRLENFRQQKSIGEKVRVYEKHLVVSEE